MKTAISLPDDLFAAADTLAEYVAKHRHAEVTERLNAVYALEDGRLDPGLADLQRQSLLRSGW
jgi:predicted transcriptional regulator